jgi:hypothetical protein
MFQTPAREFNFDAAATEEPRAGLSAGFWFAPHRYRSPRAGF